MIFRLIMQFSPALSYFLPLDPNTPLGGFFANDLALLQIDKFLMSYLISNHLLHGLCALPRVKYYNSTFTRYNNSPTCNVLIFIITVKMKRGTKFIKGIIPNVILDYLLNLMNAKNNNLCSITGSCLYKYL
jgi:hypothetical protein